MNRLDSVLTKCETVLATVVVSIMVVSIFLQVFFRYVMQMGLPWSEEVARYAMIYLIFLGVSIGTRQGAHIGIDAFVNMLSPSVRKAVAVLVSVISLVVLAVLFDLSLQMAIRIFKSGQVSPAMKIPMYIPNIALPLGFGLGTIRQGQRLLLLLGILRHTKAVTPKKGDA